MRRIIALLGGVGLLLTGAAAAKPRLRPKLDPMPRVVVQPLCGRVFGWTFCWGERVVATFPNGRVIVEDCWGLRGWPKK